MTVVTIEKRIDEWFNSQPSLQKKSHNASPKFKRFFYQRRYIARKISECVEDQKVDLELKPSKVRRKKVIVCNHCESRRCGSWCGKQEYASHITRKYWASDEDGDSIFIDMPSFYKGEIKELQKGKIYRVKGETHEYRHELYIIPDEIILIEQ